jgi:tetratricopeptide (TPR) repeat protein
LVIGCISLLGCLLGMWTAGRAGFSPLLSDYATQNSLPALASEAVRLSPSDPQAHYARAVVLSKLGRLADAIKEFENAVALRPSDYVLWLDLGYARDQNGDQEGALAAFKEAARLAPNYARPRWDIGQLLLRAERRDEAFAELRRAVASRPALLPEIIDLAWNTYSGDARAVQQAIQPQTSRENLVLARFIAERGRTNEAIQLFRAAGEIPNDARLSFLTELLAAKRFKEAYEVWSSGQKMSDSERGGGINTITDGSFESQILSKPGFGWQLAPRAQALSVALDVDRPHTGVHSLLLRFGGDATPSERIVSQVVLVEPRTRYRLSFAARTEQLVTGGPPVVVVTDASGTEGRTFAESLPLQGGTGEWRDYSVEFSTTDATEGIVLAIQRQHCPSEQCPIFGSVWFDTFSLRKLL